MELIRGIHNLRARHQQCVATIGNFDGVHLGHQAIIRQLRQKADEMRLPAVVILFEPQPREFFTPDRAPARLMSVREKLEMLAVLGVDRVLCIRFNRKFCSLSAAQFCEQVLQQGLNVKHLVVGDDFRFGHDRCGDFEFLKQYGVAAGFTVEDTHTFELDDQRVSSTRVRDAVHRGDFGESARLLGRPYRIAGRVVHGDKIGRTIGVPTANLLPDRINTPLQGVYCVTVDGIDDGIDNVPLKAVANIGYRPTVAGDRLRLEVHLLDFHEDIYGFRLHVTFQKMIRDEKKFNGLDELQQQINADIEAAKAYFAKTDP